MSNHEYVELVTVMTTSDIGLIAFVKSILIEAGIKYLIKGENLLQLVRIPASVEIQVPIEDADTAKELLKELL